MMYDFPEVCSVVRADSRRLEAFLTVKRSQCFKRQAIRPDNLVATIEKRGGARRPVTSPIRVSAPGAPASNRPVFFTRLPLSPCRLLAASAEPGLPSPKGPPPQTGTRAGQVLFPREQMTLASASFAPCHSASNRDEGLV
jgi:hypothetical protein